MSLMPFHVLGIWLRGLLALALLGAGASLLREWYEHRRVVVEEPVATRAGEVRPPDDPRARIGPAAISASSDARSRGISASTARLHLSSGAWL